MTNQFKADAHKGRLTAISTVTTRRGEALSNLHFELAPGPAHEDVGDVYRGIRFHLSDDRGTTYQTVGGGMNPSDGHLATGDRLFTPRIPARAAWVEFSVTTRDDAMHVRLDADT